jgi:hypothetical protein
MMARNIMQRVYPEDASLSYSQLRNGS